MEIKKIVVDKLPEKGCYVCRFNSTLNYCSPEEPMEFYLICTIKSSQIMTNEKYYRPSWCPLVVEEVCEWVHKFYDTYKSDCKESIVSESSYIYCPNCGKRIMYVGNEVKE